MLFTKSNHRVKEFLQETYLDSEGLPFKIRKTRVYARYAAWCSSHVFTPLSPRCFGWTLKALGVVHDANYYFLMERTHADIPSAPREGALPPGECELLEG